MARHIHIHASPKPAAPAPQTTRARTADCGCGGHKKPEPGQATSDAATVDAAPVNALYLDLDAMTPSRLQSTAEQKGVTADGKTAKIMGILRKSFSPAQLEQWAKVY